MDNIVITGMGLISPFGQDVQSYFQRLCAAEIAIGPSPWRNRDGSVLGWWAPVTDFDPLNYMSDKVVEGTDLNTQYAVAAASMAVTDSGITELDPLRTAVVHGTSMGGNRSLQLAQHKFETGGMESMDRKTQIKFWPNMGGAQIAMRWNLHGPLLTVCTACASSIDAIGTAARMLQAGMADVAIAGGTDGGLTSVTGGADGNFIPAEIFGKLLYGGPSKGTDPHRASLPFDVERSGLVQGSGSAMLVLEREEHARARGAKIHARLVGYGSLADAFHPSSPEPSGKWEARAMELALQDARLDHGMVDALVAHGTATRIGDAAEIEAINKVHGERKAPLPVMSIKGHIGHTGGSAGGMGVIAAALAMRANKFPPVAGTRNPEPAARFNVVTEKPVETELRVIQVNAFGFGGQNASVVITRPLE